MNATLSHTQLAWLIGQLKRDIATRTDAGFDPKRAQQVLDTLFLLPSHDERCCAFCGQYLTVINSGYNHLPGCPHVKEDKPLPQLVRLGNGHCKPSVSVLPF